MKRVTRIDHNSRKDEQKLTSTHPSKNIGREGWDVVSAHLALSTYIGSQEVFSGLFKFNLLVVAVENYSVTHEKLLSQIA